MKRYKDDVHLIGLGIGVFVSLECTHQKFLLF